MNIPNLYKDQSILKFKECYALEKIHGTSAHITYKHVESKMIFFSGGAKYDNFIALFDENKLLNLCKEKFNCDVTIYGEAYGGKMQGMKETYGNTLKFVVFDVKIGNTWLAVHNAEDVTKNLDLEFVAYAQISTELSEIDMHRDLDSSQAFRNGIKKRKMREGVVLRPLEEYSDNKGNRIICKHKRDEFKETKTSREVNPETLKILEDAQKIAEEWVTPQRLNHVLDKIGEVEIENTGNVIKSMTDDIYREGKNEIIESIDTRKAIGKATAKLFKQHLQTKFKDKHND